jgi:protein ImuA
VLWAGSFAAGDLYAPGLRAFGLDPARLILCRARRRADLLWAMEEALRCPALAAVVAEVDGLDLTASRRLQLAAEAGGVTGFLLRRAVLSKGGRDVTAAPTRWRVTSCASAQHGASEIGCGPTPSPLRGQGWGEGDAVRSHEWRRQPVGPPRWRLDLLQCRGGGLGSWMVERSDETGDLALVATLCDGPAEPRTPSVARLAARLGGRAQRLGGGRVQALA